MFKREHLKFSEQRKVDGTYDVSVCLTVYQLVTVSEEIHRDALAEVCKLVEPEGNI